MSEETQLQSSQDVGSGTRRAAPRAEAAAAPRCLDCLDALLAFPRQPGPLQASGNVECRGCRELLGEPRASSSHPASVHRRILLVSSKPDAQHRLAGILSAFGVAVGGYAHPEEAAGMLRGQRSEVVLIAEPIEEAAAILGVLRDLDPEVIGLFVGEDLDDAAGVAALSTGFLGSLDLAEAGPDETRLLSEALRIAEIQRDRRRLRESLIRERNRYRTTIHHLPVGVVALDRDLRIVSINPHASRMTALEGVPEVLEDFLAVVIPDGTTRRRVLRAIEAARAEGTAAQVYEVSLGAGEERKPRTVEVSAIPVDPGDISGISVLLALVDLTHERELARDLAEKERLASIGQMAASVAHELRNPLAGISGALDILLAEIPPNEDLVRIRQEVQNQLRRLNVLSSELLNFAKPVRVQRISVTVRDLVDSVATTLSRDPANHQIEWRIDGGEVPIDVDGVHFPAVLLNLAVNAVQATGAGPVVTVRARSNGREVQLGVEDEGAGFDPSKLEEVFRPFFTTKARGTGLGLPLCRKIVEAHGGTIRAENREEGGGRVIIRMPAAQMPRS